MAKSSTYQELLQHDIMQWQSLIFNYRKQSSLAGKERYENRPIQKKQPRDRVMRKIMKIEMDKALNRIMNCQLDEVMKKSI